MMFVEAHTALIVASYVISCKAVQPKLENGTAGAVTLDNWFSHCEMYTLIPFP